MGTSNKTEKSERVNSLFGLLALPGGGLVTDGDFLRMIRLGFFVGVVGCRAVRSKTAQKHHTRKKERYVVRISLGEDDKTSHDVAASTYHLENIIFIEISVMISDANGDALFVV
jgi:hypothetical protein